MFRNAKLKDYLETVPNEVEIKKDKETKIMAENMIVQAVTPITFFDMHKDHSGRMIDTIMSLPMEIQGINNLNMMRTSEIYNRLSDNYLNILNEIGNDVQSQNVYGVIVDIILSNFQIFAYQAPSLSDIEIVHDPIRDELCHRFGYFIHNNIDGCMDKIKEFIDNIYHIDRLYSPMDAIDPVTYKSDDTKMNNTIAMMQGLSTHANELITYVICDFVSYVIYSTVLHLTDDQVDKLIQLIKNKYSINKNLTLNDRITLRSFLSSSIREDIKILILNNIVPAVNHTIDNAFMTSYFVYRDLLDERNYQFKK